MLTALALLLALPVMLPLVVFTAEIVAGLRRTPRAASCGETPRTVILMPAHDEAGGIGAAIAGLDGARRDGVDLLVVADNCGDGTAAVARTAGAWVIERHDPLRRGKGYALAFGRDHLAADPPECVIVLDADCVVEGDGVADLARACVAAGAAVQSTYLFRPQAGGQPTAAVSNFAFLVKNMVRQRGMAWLGGVAALTGTGMAIPWRDLRDAPLASGDLVEDLSLGIWLTRRGRSPRFAAEVTTWSDAVSGEDLLAQRSRWEHGFLATARRQALPLLAHGLAHRSRSECWLALHLLVPPLALLVMLGTAALLATSLLALAGASWWPPAALALLLAAAGGGVLFAWSRFGRGQIDARTLLGIPRYVLMKLPLYRGLARGGPSQWRRTRRAGEEDGRDQ